MGTLTVRSKDPDKPDQRFQRYRRVSGSKSGGTHYFRLPLSADGEEVVVSRPGWTTPLRCGLHPKSRVARDDPSGPSPPSLGGHRAVSPSRHRPAPGAAAQARSGQTTFASRRSGQL